MPAQFRPINKPYPNSKRRNDSNGQHPPHAPVNTPPQGEPQQEEAPPQVAICNMGYIAPVFTCPAPDDENGDEKNQF
jgi:hypothetical protein